MSNEFQQVRSRLGPGREIVLEPSSPIYRGPYSSHVIDVSDEGVRVRVPLDQGKIVLLPVGTRVALIASGDGGSVRADAVIVDRTGGSDRSLLLQAAPRESIRQHQKSDVRCPIVAVSSGKGGVGKTTLVSNLAIALTRLGKRTCIIDGDLGTANVDVLLNLSPPYNLAHVIHGERHMLEVLVEGPEGVIVLPGGSGFQDLTMIDRVSFDALMEQFLELVAYADFMLIDTGSGLSPSVTNFILAAGEGLLITTPEPHAVMDCYALIKVLASQGFEGKLGLVINRAESEAEGREIGRKMLFASERFLGMELELVGHIPDDPAVPRSVRRQIPVVIDDPRSRAGQQLMRIAERLVGEVEREARRPAMAVSFLERMRRLFPLGRTGV